MPRPWMRSFVVFTLAAAGLCAGADGNEPEFVVPNVQDFTIKTRETIDLAQSTVRTNTLYFKGAWQRRELELQFPSSLPPQSRVRQATITRCDERRTLELNHETRLYAWSPLSFAGRDLYWARSRGPERPEPPRAGADLTITINTVDTGERRQVCSYSARHVITTISKDPCPGAHTRPGESVADGWYLDLPPAGCWNAAGGLTFVTGSALAPGGAPDRIKVEFRGAGQRGFPIEETTRSRGEHEPPITTMVKLIDISEAVLDKSLFEVPAGYRPAVPRLIGGFDMTKPDTVANRGAAYWRDLVTLTGDLFRF